MKGTKGITLVALIITIIVLLILAGVAIASIQENDIIKYANDATTKWEDAALSEELKLIETSLKMGLKMNPQNYTIQYDGTDAGVIYKALTESGLTVDSNRVQDEKITLNPENGDLFIVSEEEGKYYTLIESTTNSGNTAITRVDLKVLADEDNVLLNITDISILTSLELTITEINAHIAANIADYTYTGDTDESVILAINGVYNILTEKGITLDKELLNEQGNGWNYEVIQGKLKLDDYGSSLKWLLYGFDFNCSKGGETITVRAQLYSHNDGYTQIRSFIIK